MPRHIPIIVVLEGEYTTWTLKWAKNYAPEDYQAVVNDFSSFNKLETIIMLAGGDPHDLEVIDISDGSRTVIVGGSNANEYIYRFAHHSILGTYFAVVSEDQDSIRIYKDGVLLQTLSVDVVDDSFWGVLMSPSGKYLFVCYTDASEPPGSRGEYWLYEGS